MKNQNQKNNFKIKKTILFIALTPYIIFFLLGIYNCISSSFKNQVLDLEALIEPLNNFWHNVIIDLNIFYICLTIFCVGYPIYYLLDKSGKNKSKENDTNTKIKVSKSFILYILSFIPYFFLIYSCIFGIEFGFFGNTSTYYGFKALLIAATIGCIIPVYPITLIFQIIYTIKRYKDFTPNIKKFIKFIIISIILLILIPSFINLGIKKINLNTTFNNDRIIIEKYLIEEFGKQHYKNMEIVKNNYISNHYTIKTTLLDYGFSVELNKDRNNIISNDFYEKFDNENSMNTELEKKLNALYELPDYIKIKSKINKFDIKNYTEDEKIETLLYNCEYSIHSVEILKKSFDKQEIIQIIKNFYIKNYKDIEKNLDKTSISGLHFYVKIDERYYANIQTIKQKDTLTLFFSGYNYSDGYTIDYDKISISLSTQ